VILLVLLVDQLLKFWVKLNMQIGDEIMLFGNWGRLHFIENKGMAFGMEFGGNYGKLLLTIFRLIAVGVLSYVIRNQIKIKAHFGFLIALSLILAGALGNIIDSIFYGVIFNDSYGQIAQLMPSTGGYGAWFQGHVVDMLYFPLIDTHWPSWMPFLGGKSLSFFDPIFNIADSSISTGVFSILIFQGIFFKEKEIEKVVDESFNITENSLEKEG
jgi:signal peptidase II